MSLLLNYSTWEQSNAESKGPNAFSYESHVLVYKAEQSSEALASMTEAFGLSLYSLPDSLGQL